jgi:hypothetical protein
MPEIGPRTASDAAEIGDLHDPLAAAVIKMRLPSISSILMQSPEERRRLSRKATGSETTPADCVTETSLEGEILRVGLLPPVLIIRIGRPEVRIPPCNRK